MENSAEKKCPKDPNSRKTESEDLPPELEALVERAERDKTIYEDSWTRTYVAAHAYSGVFALTTLSRPNDNFLDRQSSLLMKSPSSTNGKKANEPKTK